LKLIAQSKPLLNVTEDLFLIYNANGKVDKAFKGKSTVSVILQYFNKVV